MREAHSPQGLCTSCVFSAWTATTSYPEAPLQGISHISVPVISHLLVPSLTREGMGSALFIALTPLLSMHPTSPSLALNADLENESKILSIENFKLLQLTLRFHWQGGEGFPTNPPHEPGRSGFQESLPRAWYLFIGTRKEEAGKAGKGLPERGWCLLSLEGSNLGQTKLSKPPEYP